MRAVLVWAVRLLLVAVVVVLALFAWKRDEVARLWSVMTLFDEGRITRNFSHMDEMFLTVPMDRGEAAPSALPHGAQWDLPADVADWVARRRVTALVVLKGGAIVHESYYLGTAPEDRRISWSVAKSVLSALTGVLLAEGAIDSIDDPVTKYAPMLAGSAYDGTSLRNVLQMSSGVRFDEDYLSFWSDINRMGRVLALGGSMDAFTTGQRHRDAEPGARMQYVSTDTHVVAMVLRGATGRSLPDLMDDYIVRPMGFEADPVYITDGYGVAFALGGLNMTTRDYARFGQMMANGGIWQGVRVVPEDWIAESTAPSAPTAAGEPGYGYQWWIPEGWGEGEFLAQGIYGQFIYVNRPLGVVVAVNSADLGFEDAGVEEENYAVLRSIAARVGGG
ncbi:MAG: serine hydrolase [Rubellimicrobium sp.]|nr:serine hydrolase [Rubellimicrobium sp.]